VISSDRRHYKLALIAKMAAKINLKLRARGHIDMIILGNHKLLMSYIYIYYILRFLKTRKRRSDDNVLRIREKWSIFVASRWNEVFRIYSWEHSNMITSRWIILSPYNSNAIRDTLPTKSLLSDNKIGMFILKMKFTSLWENQ